MNPFLIFFSYKGSINRLTYWLSLIFIAFIYDWLSKSGEEWVFIVALFSLFAIQVKRCNDLNWSGWWSLLVILLLFPKVGEVFLIWLFDDVLKIYQDDWRSVLNRVSFFVGIGWLLLLGILPSNDFSQPLLITRYISNKIARLSFFAKKAIFLTGKKLAYLISFFKKPVAFGKEENTKKEKKAGYKNDKEQPVTYISALKTLGLKTGANSKEIKRAYKKCIQEYHPDKVSSLGIELRKVAEIKAREINIAYQYLKKSGRV